MLYFYKCAYICKLKQTKTVYVTFVLFVHIKKIKEQKL